MPQTYLRYTHSLSRGVVYSAPSPVLFDPSGTLLLTPSLDTVLVISRTAGNVVRRIGPSALSSPHLSFSDSGHAIYSTVAPKTGVTCIGLSSQGLIAVGRENGRIDIYRLSTGSHICTFVTHASAVTALSFSLDGLLLVSGSHDTTLGVHDIAAQQLLRRLEGHVNGITHVSFMFGNANNTGALRIVSASRDHLVRIWDMESSSCLDTISVFRSEVWALAVHPAGLIVAASSGPEIEVFSWDESGERAVHLGHVLAPSLRNNISEFVFSPDGEWMFAHDAGRFVVSFKVLLKEEERARKKRKRDQTSTNSNADAGADSTSASEEAALWFSLRDTLPMHKKLKHIAVSPAYKKDKDAKYFLAQAYGNNGIIVSEYSETLSSLSSAERDKTFLSSAKPLGQREAHTGEIRCSALSSNANQLVTADNASLCVWTFPSLAYIARIDWGSEQETNPLSIAICPNDRHVVVGTKEGELLLIDLHLQSIVDRVPAHSGAVWSISIAPQLAPGQSTSPTLANAVFYSGSADKTVKGWSLGTSAPIPSTSSKDSKDAAKKGSTNTKKEAEPASKAMLHEIKTYPADDAVLSVVATPRFLAVATLDNSVRLYFRDTGRFHLALYGHSLPVLSLDVSDDESLLYTASADRTLRIWGTDFGDCHRIMKAAHADSITSVAAVPRTHYFASGSKDGTVCLWDGDRFERIQTVCSGAGHVASLSFGKDGLRFVSVGGDRCIRVFEREGREIIVPSEEKEREQDAMRNEETAQQASGAGIAGATTQASAAALSRVIEAYGIAERIEGVTEKTAEDMGMNLEQALWFMVFDQKYVPGKDSERGVPPSLMDAVVGLLSSECVLRLLKMLWNVLGEESRYPVHMACVQLLLRVIQTHHASLLARSDHAILGSEEELYRVQEMLQRRKDIFGMNSAALERLRRRMDQGHAGEWNMVVDTAKEVKVHDKGSKGSSGKKGKKRSANESM